MTVDHTALTIKKMCNRIVTLDPQLFSAEAGRATTYIVDWLFNQDMRGAVGKLRMAEVMSMQYQFHTCDRGYADDCVYYLIQAAAAWGNGLSFDEWANLYAIPFNACFADACAFELTHIARKG